jgi:site-specific DNA-cytosine methylase
MAQIRCLTLFSGTHSVSRALEASGVPYEEVTLDWAEPADLTMDILEFDPAIFKPGAFNLVWASPECTQYSRARTTGSEPRQLDVADSYVAKTLQVIDHLKPDVWVIENPESGLLKTRPLMLLRPFYVADYCMYDTFYRKRTAFWSNIPFELKTCGTGHGTCPYVLHGKHVAGLQESPQGKCRGMIPVPLLVSMIEQALPHLDLR